MFTKVDRLTSSKFSELRKRIQQQKPHIISISEMKPNNSKGTSPDYNIPGYSLYVTSISIKILAEEWPFINTAH